MALTYEQLRDDESIRDNFLSQPEDIQQEVFGLMKAPVGLEDKPEEIKLIQSKILSLPTTIKETGQLDAPLEWKDVPVEAFKNIPSSSLEFGKNIWQAIRHPVQTAKAVGGIALGGAQKLIPGEQGSEQTFDQTVEFFKERYSGVENLKNTIANDPIGFLSDISVIASGAGGALNIASKVASTGSKVSKVTQAVGKVMSRGQLADPLIAGTKLSTKIIKPSGGVVPINSTIKSVLKFEKSTGFDKIDQLANEFIKRGLGVDRRTEKVLSISMKRVNREINRMVNDATSRGKTVRTKNIAGALDDLLDRMDKHGLGGAGKGDNIAEIKRLKQQFLDVEGKTLTPRQLQDIKQGLGKNFDQNLSDKFGKVRDKVNDKFRDESMKTLNEIFPEISTKPKGAKITDKGIGDIVGIENLNKELGISIGLSKQISKRIIELEQTPNIAVKGLIAGGLATIPASVVLGTGGSAVAGGLTFAASAFIIGKVLTSPNLQVSIAKQLAKVRGIRMSVARKIVKTRLAEQLQSIQQVGRVANVQEGALSDKDNAIVNELGGQ